MNVLVWNAAESMVYERRERPAVKPDEVLVKVEAVGICGSEIEGYLGHNSLRIPPLVMGHEFCGRVAQLGAEAGSYEIGQKVVVNPLLYCGTCERCLRGLTQLCDSRSIVGIHRPGGFADYVAVPQRALVAVPEDVGPFRAALAEPLACSLRATRRAMERHTLPHTVVFGAGGIGLLCALVARLLGADRIIIVDTNGERLKIARGLGFAHTINPAKEDVAASCQAVCGTKGVGVVIDAAGFQPTRETAARIVNPGGTIMNIGLGIDGTQLPVNHMIRSEIELLGSFCYSAEDFRNAVDLLIAGRITEEGWTEIRPLSAGHQAFADLTAGRVYNGKIFLQPTENETR